MLKVVFKSKYICTFLIVMVLLMISSCFAAATFGDALHNYAERVLSQPLLDSEDTSNKYITYYLKHHSGKYTLKGHDFDWRVIDVDGQIIYETDAQKVMLANRENYLWETTDGGFTTIVNIKTKETEWTSKLNERVYTDNAGFFVIKESLDEKAAFEDVQYYLLDKDFNAAMDGLIFKYVLNDIRHGQIIDYIYGTLKETGEGCVLNSKGEIVYKMADATINFVLDDVAWVYFEEEHETYHVSLAGENQGQFVEVEWDE